MKDNIIFIFNNNIFDVEVYMSQFKDIQEAKEYFSKIETLFVDLKHKTIFIDEDNTFINIPIDKCIFKICTKNFENLKLTKENKDFLLSNLLSEDELLITDDDMKKLPLDNFIEEIKYNATERVVNFTPIAYTTF